MQFRLLSSTQSFITLQIAGINTKQSDGTTNNHIDIYHSGIHTIVGSTNLLRQQPQQIQLRQHPPRIRQRSVFHTVQGQLFHRRHSNWAENHRRQLRRKVSGEHRTAPHQKHVAFQHLSVSCLLAEVPMERVSRVAADARPQLQPRHRTVETADCERQTHWQTHADD